jgi:hypothetical protein
MSPYLVNILKIASINDHSGLIENIMEVVGSNQEIRILVPAISNIAKKV